MKDRADLLKKPQSCCLVVVDVQEKLAAVMYDRENLIHRCAILIQIADRLKIPVLWCQQVPKALGPTVHRLRELLKDREPINKTSFNCCGEENFIKAMEKSSPQTVFLCGIETHVCVFQTAADLIRRGLRVHVIADAVSSRTPENKQIGLQRMRDAGAVISSVEMLLFELLADSQHEAFKELAALIK